MTASTHQGQRGLLLMQIFSTIGFSVLYGTLILYATQGLKLPDARATALTGGFIAFNYALHVLGGYIGGRLLSFRALFVLGMALQALGSVIIALPHFLSLLWGLSLFLTGSGLNVICINCMLTQLFAPEDKKRESAFLWNYSGMNVGFFIGFTLSGFFQLSHHYMPLFLISSIGSLISLGFAIFYWKHLRDQGTQYADATPPERDKRVVAAGAIAGAVVLALVWLLEHGEVARILILVMGGVVATLFAYLGWKESVQEQAKKMRAFLILALGGLVFFILYQMAPMGLTLFYARNVEQTVWGLQIAPQWLQNINTVIIVVGGPLMASWNQKLRSRGRKIRLPFQFSLALFLIGAGFLLPAMGTFFADPRGFSSIGWVVGCYVLQSIGELFISPIAYAMVGQLMPKRLQSLAMGGWLMLVGVAAVFASYCSQFSLGDTGSVNPVVTNFTYAKTFLSLGIGALVASLILWSLRRRLNSLIQEG